MSDKAASDLAGLRETSRGQFAVQDAEMDEWKRRIIATGKLMKIADVASGNADVSELGRLAPGRRRRTKPLKTAEVPVDYILRQAGELGLPLTRKDVEEFESGAESEERKKRTS